MYSNNLGDSRVRLLPDNHTDSTNAGTPPTAPSTNPPTATATPNQQQPDNSVDEISPASPYSDSIRCEHEATAPFPQKIQTDIVNQTPSNVPIPSESQPGSTHDSNILEKTVLLLSATLFPFAVGWTNYDLADKNPSNKHYEIPAGLIAALANALMASGYGKKLLNHVTKELSGFDWTDKISVAVVLVPSLITTLSALKLNLDSLDGLGYGKAAKALLLAPNLHYTFSTCYLSLLGLVKRLRTNSIHLRRQLLSGKCGNPDFSAYYALKKLLEINGPQIKLPTEISELSTPDDIAEAIFQAATEQRMMSGRTKTQFALNLAKLLVAATFVTIVLGVIPPNFQRLTADGLNDLQELDAFRKTLGWLFPANTAWGDSAPIVMIGLFPRVALYIVSALDVPENAEKAFRILVEDWKKLIPTVPSYCYSLGMLISAVVVTVMTLSGRGLEGEAELAMLPVNTSTANSSAYPYPGFGSVANEMFTHFAPALFLFKAIHFTIGVCVATMISAGAIANGNGNLSWYLQWKEKQGSEMAWWQAILFYCLGAYSELAKKPAVIADFGSKLDKALQKGNVDENGNLVFGSTVGPDGLPVTLGYKSVQSSHQNWINSIRASRASVDDQGPKGVVGNSTASLFSVSTRSLEQYNYGTINKGADSRNEENEETDSNKM